MIHSTTYIVHTRVLSLSKQHIQHQYKTCIFTDLTPWTPSQETSYARKKLYCYNYQQPARKLLAKDYIIYETYILLFFQFSFN